MPFDPNKYLSSKGFDPDAYLKTKAGEPATSAAESFARGGGQGLSFGFGDELAGGANALVEAAGETPTSTLGALGVAAKNLTPAGLANTASKGIANLLLGNKSTSEIVKEYVSARDAERASNKAAQESHPYVYGGGEVAGSIASGFIPGLNVAKGATLGGRALMAGGLGAAQGIGNSEGDLTKGEVGTVAQDALTSAVLTAGLQAGGEKILSPLAKAAGKGGKMLLRGALGVPEEVTERYLANPKAVNEAGNLLDVAKTLPDKLDFVTGELGELAATASGKLKDSRSVPISQIMDELDGLVAKAVDPKQLAGVQDIRNKLLSDYMERSNKAALQGGAGFDKISEIELKEIVRKLQAMGDFNSPILKADQALINQSSGKLNSILKEANPEYKAAVGDVAEQIRLRTDLIKKFGLEKTPSGGFQETDRTVGALKQLANGSRVDKARVAEELERLGYGDLSNKVQDSLAKSAFDKRFVQGSRNVNLGAIIGNAATSPRAIVSSAVGTVFGGPVGAAVGAAAGGAIDFYGPRIGKALLDTKIFSSQQLQKLAGTKYGQALKSAAGRGNNSLGASHFILYNSDPEYRRLVTEGEE